MWSRLTGFVSNQSVDQIWTPLYTRYRATDCPRYRPLPDLPRFSSAGRPSELPITVPTNHFPQSMRLITSATVPKKRSAAMRVPAGKCAESLRTTFAPTFFSAFLCLLPWYTSNFDR